MATEQTERLWDWTPQGVLIYYGSAPEFEEFYLAESDDFDAGDAARTLADRLNSLESRLATAEAKARRLPDTKDAIWVIELRQKADLADEARPFIDAAKAWANWQPTLDAMLEWLARYDALSPATGGDNAV